jgi:putative FmdB family regulatory protein
MPIYEYRCAKCSETFEELVFGDAAPACPKCGSARVDKMMSCPCLHDSASAGGSYGDAYGADCGGGCGSGGGGSSGCGGCAGGNCAGCGH